MIARGICSRLAAGLASAVVVFVLSGVFALHAADQTGTNKTVQYEETIKGPPLADGVQLLEKKQVKVLGNNLMREEIDVKYFDKDGKSLSEKRRRYYQVYDAKQDKLLAVFPDKHGYVVTNFSQRPIAGELQPPPKAASIVVSIGNLYDSVHNVQWENGQKLPDWKINGKVVNGFLVEEKQEMPYGTQTYQRTYWIDPETKLPVQIEIKMRTAAKPEMKDNKAAALQAANWHSDQELQNIVFDAPLDAKLFSLEIPEGYTNLAEKKSGMESKGLQAPAP